MKLLKLPVFAACLEEDGVAQVHIQAHRDLIWPYLFRGFLMLKYGWSMPIPIPDLKWTEKGIHATLSVNRDPYLTFVPWDAIVAIAPKGQGVMVTWDWYVPQKVQDITTHRPVAPTPPHLSIVK